MVTEASVMVAASLIVEGTVFEALLNNVCLKMISNGLVIPNIPQHYAQIVLRCGSGGRGVVV
jgi:hypothetical protein